MFVGSPIKHSMDEMLQIGRKLKKFNIGVDIISFGPIDDNRELLNQFINTVNNANNSSILEVPVGFYIMDSLFSSQIMTGDTGYDVGMESSTTGQVQPTTTTTNNQPQGTVGMSQFERDINMAIQQSLEEEKKKAEVKGETTATPNKDVEMKPLIEEEEFDEEAELEKARLLSMKEFESFETVENQKKSKN